MEWKFDTLPLVEGDYLTMNKEGKFAVRHWCEGWNCFLDMQTGEIYRLLEIKDIVCWTEIGKPIRRDIE